MAVYTEVSDDELRAFATFYDIGEVLSCKGIAEGGGELELPGDDRARQFHPDTL